VVLNHQLKKDEVTALASGVVQAKIVGIPAVRVENGVVHVKVKARIEVDTSILDRQIQEIMKEKGTLKRLEEEQKKVRELEDKLANLKSSEVKRLEELNAQALALERERDRQRLFMQEQSLKAKGELSKAEADRLAKERELQERVNRTLAEQEKAKREEALALAADWRMPTQNELAGLYDSSKSYKATQWDNNVRLTELIQLSNCCPWASETHGSNAAYFRFTRGERQWNSQSGDNLLRALPVRYDK
jgi:hypothetical protein